MPSRNKKFIILPKSWSGHGRTGSAGPARGRFYENLGTTFRRAAPAKSLEGKKRPKTRVRFRTTLDFDRGYPRKKMVNANLVHYPQSSRGYVYPPKINSVRIFQQLYRLQSLISPNGSRCRQAESDVNYDPFHV